MITITNILDCEKYLDTLTAVVFDLDDTLYPEKDYVRSGYRAVAKEFSQIENMEKKLWNAFENHLPAIDVVLDREDIRDINEKEKALKIYRMHVPEITVYPGIVEMLQRLKKQKKLGLITDGRPIGQRAKLRALGIESYFDKIIVTDELGGTKYRKPAKTAFILMQKALGVPFEEMVYIGDNTKKDFVAPEGLGMQTIWFMNSEGLYN